MITAKDASTVNLQTAETYDVRKIPQFLIFQNGKLVDKTIGAIPKKKFIAKIEAALAS